MKEHRVVPSQATVTSIDVSGRLHHYAHSERLGKFRAILIGEDENLPVPFQLTDKGKKAIAEKSHRQEVDEIIDEFEAEQAKKELSKGDKLAILMSCSERLHKRWLAAWEAHQALPVYDVRLNAAFAKLKRITSANSRLNKKIADMLDE